MFFDNLEKSLKEEDEKPDKTISQLTKEELKKITTFATLTGLLFAGIISAGLILTVLFMVFVWFR